MWLRSRDKDSVCSLICVLVPSYRGSVSACRGLTAGSNAGVNHRDAKKTKSLPGVDQGTRSQRCCVVYCLAHRDAPSSYPCDTDVTPAPPCGRILKVCAKVQNKFTNLHKSKCILLGKRHGDEEQYPRFNLKDCKLTWLINFCCANPINTEHYTNI